ncbi:SAM-dependent DNA methyltransferase, partial [Candidatus Dependentiae bacterium]|nr:SAM-dependent DNA methyltransferase [Candidatus Dependentiae bacterium]
MDKKDNNNYKEIEKRLWDIADELRANSKLKASEYATPVLGLIFLKFADFKFQYAADKLAKEFKKKGKSVKPKKLHFQAKGILFIPEEARFSNLINIPEGSDIGSAVNNAMKAVEDENEKLKDTLPKNFNILENDTLFALLKLMSSIPMDIEGDVFGKIYEYFLGKFALAEGQKGGEFFTPTSLVKLIVEVIEPYHGRILDPACGSGGMFVQSAAFVKRHKHNPSKEISIYGQESTNETVKLCKLNL